jgi:hypothetical protein
MVKPQSGTSRARADGPNTFRFDPIGRSLGTKSLLCPDSARAKIGIVDPLRVAFELDGGQLLLGDLDSLGVGARACRELEFRLCESVGHPGAVRILERAPR